MSRNITAKTFLAVGAGGPAIRAQSGPITAEIDSVARPHRTDVLFRAAIVVLSGLVSLGSGGSGPTEPTKIGDGSNGTGTAESALADQIQGTFKGMFQNPSLPTSISDYEIIVTKLSDTSVRVSPASGGISSTFVANLSSQVSGSVTSITLKAPSDILDTNGTFVAATGRLSYTYHLGGSAAGNVEVFSGTKQ